MSALITTNPLLNPTAAAFVPRNNSNRTKIIRVILLRHGEREDETQDYDKRQHTRQERTDPALTALGHCQALAAWETILNSLPNDNKPIFVASSPLRRCMGTALMVASASETINSSIRFVLSSENPGEDESTNTKIPILIMNGLGDCAARMQRMGGIGKVVKGGWLNCAASRANDLSNAPTRLQQSLGSICTTALQATNQQTKQMTIEDPWTEDEETGGGGDKSANDNTTEPPKLQFWRESNYHYRQRMPPRHISPLTNAQTLKEHASVASPPPSSPFPMPKNAPSRDERCDQALERAVLQTAVANLDTCILVTHREAIRFVQQTWVRPKDTIHGHRQLHGATKTYCCVAIYKVTVEDGRVLDWDTQGVVPYPSVTKTMMEME